MFNLKVIIASTRPSRVGATIAEWFVDEAKKNKDFKIEVLDLQKINLPVFDEPNHPAMQQYTQQHTKDWSAMISPADAFVVVTPEYNYMIPAPLLNAFTYLYKEWNYKPIAFVSYGGISAGTRAVQTEKILATTLKMMPMYEAVNIPHVAQQIKDGKFEATENQVKAVGTMLTELAKWTKALKTMR